MATIKKRDSAAGGLAILAAAAYVCWKELRRVDRRLRRKRKMKEKRQ